MRKLLNRLRFAFLMRIYTTDKTVDEVIKKIMTLNIREITYTDFHINIVTDSYTYTMWNSNAYYAWLSNGYIVNNSSVIFTWNDKMPSKNTMAAFKTFIEPFIDKDVLNKLS